MRGYVPDTFILYLAPDKSEADKKRYHIAKVEPPHERVYDVDAERLFKVDTQRNRRLQQKYDSQGNNSEAAAADAALLGDAAALRDEDRVREELMRRGLDVKGGMNAMGDRLRAERIFVLASGGRVLTVGANDNAVDVREALLRDLEHDAGDGALVTGGGLWLDDERARGHLEINGKRLEWLQSLSTKLLNGDEVRWVEDPEAAHGELEEPARP